MCMAHTDNMRLATYMVCSDYQFLTWATILFFVPCVCRYLVFGKLGDYPAEAAAALMATTSTTSPSEDEWQCLKGALVDMRRHDCS